MNGALTSRRALAVFAVFAAAYLLSSTVRGVTATLAPTLTREMRLSAPQLGLLGGAYFLGFAVLQLPLGGWLDRFGPRAIVLTSLLAAIAGCLVFAAAEGFGLLLFARWLGGIGVSACLIAPLAGARRWLDAASQQAANAWMLMAGSVGLLMATLPVQWLLPIAGWRGIFLGLGLLFGLVWLGTYWLVPGQPARAPAQPGASLSWMDGYRLVFSDPFFRRIAWLGLINYAVLVALQTLWIGPWLTQVTGASGPEATAGLFAIHLSALPVFLGWACLNPLLHARGLSAQRVLAWGVPPGVIALAVFAFMGPLAGWKAFAVYCLLSSALSLTHPAVGAAFPEALAGRAVAAFNLLLFIGVFIAQWAIGGGIGWLCAAHWPVAHAYQAVFGLLALCCALSWGWYAHGIARRR